MALPVMFSEALICGKQDSQLQAGYDESLSLSFDDVLYSNNSIQLCELNIITVTINC
jgi:hypothetical protein